MEGITVFEQCKSIQSDTCGLGALKILLAAASLLVFSASCLAANPLGDAARTSGKPLIADFGLNICKQCIKQSEALEEYKKAVGDKVPTRFVHVTKEADTASNYKVMLIPTLIFFDREGRELFRQVGYMPAEEMLAKTKELGLLK